MEPYTFRFKLYEFSSDIISKNKYALESNPSLYFDSAKKVQRLVKLDLEELTYQAMQALDSLNEKPSKLNIVICGDFSVSDRYFLRSKFDNYTKKKRVPVDYKEYPQLRLITSN